jgi:GT2 family glycosyltransferase
VSAPKIIAVVVTHNRPDDLKRIIIALTAQTYRLKHILVIDNASDIPAMQVLKKTPPVKIFKTAVNIGGAGGFAWGISLASKLNPDWVWVMDDDALPQPNALEILVRFILHPLIDSSHQFKNRSENQIGSLSSAVEEFGTCALQHRRYFSKFWGCERVVKSKEYRQQALKIDAASFVGQLISAKAIDKIGLPNDQFFLAYDDTEYSLRLRQAGFENWLIPASRVVHARKSENRLRYSNFGLKHYYNIRNRIYVLKKYATHKNTAVLFGITHAMGLWMVSEKINIFQSFRLLLRAIVDGCNQNLGQLKIKS